MKNGNVWVNNSLLLGKAYSQNIGSMRFNLIARAISEFTPSNQGLDIIDIGGGHGEQAIVLAREGHRVTVLDIDEEMLNLARERIENEDAEVKSRIRLILGDGTKYNFSNLPKYDVVCCHSVIKYEENIIPFLGNIVGLLKEGGIMSIVSLNTRAFAMRSGLQGKWKDAIESLKTGNQAGKNYIPVYQHSMESVLETLANSGLCLVEWYGIGIFTDHITVPIITDSPQDVYDAEWMAGKIEPYRSVARCFHLLVSYAQE